MCLLSTCNYKKNQLFLPFFWKKSNFTFWVESFCDHNRDHPQTCHICHGLCPLYILQNGHLDLRICHHALVAHVDLAHVHLFHVTVLPWCEHHRHAFHPFLSLHLQHHGDQWTQQKQNQGDFAPPRHHARNQIFQILSQFHVSLHCFPDFPHTLWSCRGHETWC